MNSRHSNRTTENSLNFPKIGTKNIICVLCLGKFFIKDFFRIKGGHIPLLRHCGHAVCEQCARDNASNPCPICKDEPKLQKAGDIPLAPINIYAVGLLSVNLSRPWQEKNINDNQDFIFRKSIQLQMLGINSDTCSECNRIASSRCKQCSTLFCCKCFSKFHSFKQNKDHEKEFLIASKNKKIIDLISMNCPNHLFNQHKHWCENCNVACCSDCIIANHRDHATLLMEQVNQVKKAELIEAYETAVNILCRTESAKKRVVEILNNTEQVDDAGIVKTKIAQHFIHLHGVLQNLEERMIEKVESQLNSHQKRLMSIQTELQKLEAELRDTILMANLAKEQSDCVNYVSVIEKLKEFTKARCNVVETSLLDDNGYKISFHANRNNIIKELETHCNVEVPPAEEKFNLVSNKDLPEDYQIEPIDEDKLNIPQLFPTLELSPPSLSSASSLSLFPLPSASGYSTEMNGSLAQSQTNLSFESQMPKGTKVTVTHINHPFCFYIREKEYDEIFNQVKDELDNYKTFDSSVPVNNVELGEIYAVECNKSDRPWYRGRIKEIKDDPENSMELYEVFAIDYGFIEKEVNKSKLRVMAGTLKDITPCIRQESLFDITPIDKEWSLESIEFMENLIKSSRTNPILYSVDVENKLGVDLLISTSPIGYPSSVRDALIFSGHGKFISKEKLYVLNPLSINAYIYETLPLNDYIDVICLNVDSPNCFYVRKQEYNEEYFNNMIKHMTDDYKESKKQRGIIYSPTVGMNIVAPYENLWHRGVITEICGVKTVKIFFVDLGITRTACYTKIRKLDPRYASTTAMAIKVCLRDVMPVNGQNWTIEANAAVKTFMEPTAKIIVYKTNDDIHLVDVFNEYGETLKHHLEMSSYSQLSVMNKKQVNCGKMKGQNKKSKNKRQMNANNIYNDDSLLSTAKCMTGGMYSNTNSNINEKSEEKHDPFKVRVMIENIISPDEIYVSIVDHNQDSYDDFQSKLNMHYRKKRSTNEVELKEDLVCVVYDDENDGFYRAKITKVISSDEATAFLIDVGITRTVTKDKLQHLKSSFFKAPMHSLQIKLGGILPCGGTSSWQSTSCKKLEEIILENVNCQFFITKVAQNDDDNDEVMIVDLYMKKPVTENPLAPCKIHDTLINRMLVEEGYALPIKNFNQIKLKIPASYIKEQISTNENNGTINNGLNKESSSSDDDEVVNEVIDDDIDPPKNYSASFPSDKPTWLPAKPISEKIFIALPTYVDWDGFVYLHSVKENGEMLKTIEDRLSEHYNSSESCPETDINWSPGDMCISRFHDTDMWGRAVVHKVRPKKIALEFIDYGSMEWQDPKLLRKNIMLQDIPRQCIKCKIYGLKPLYRFGKWPEYSLQRLHVTLVDKKCLTTILRETSQYSVISIQLIEPRDCHLITYLKEDLHMLLSNKEDTEDEEDEDDKNDYSIVICEENNVIQDADNSNNVDDTDIIDDDDDVDSINASDSVSVKALIIENGISNKVNKEVDVDEKSAPVEPNSYLSYMMYPLPESCEYFNALIAEVDQQEPNIVWLHPIVTEGEKLISEMSYDYQLLFENLLIHAKNQPVLTKFKVGDPCVAKYQVDNCWYRCSIIRSDMEGFVQVEFVDWGNIDWVPYDEVRKIKPDWLNLPKMALKCRLWNTRLSNNFSGAREWIKKAAIDKTLSVHIQGYSQNQWIVQLFEHSISENQILFYQPLIDLGLFELNTNYLSETLLNN